MVSNNFWKIFWSGKNAYQMILRTYFYAVLNSEHISPSKDFSKMLLKARNSILIDRAAILIPLIHLGILVHFSWPIFYVPWNREIDPFDV